MLVLFFSWLNFFKIFQLDKVYEGNNPDDDVMERYHEMMKMRQEMMKEADTNEDKVISLDEFLSWTKKSDFKKDPEWKVGASLRL